MQAAVVAKQATGGVGHIKWLGIDTSAYACACAAVVLCMLQSACSVDHVVQVRTTHHFADPEFFEVNSATCTYLRLLHACLQLVLQLSHVESCCRCDANRLRSKGRPEQTHMPAYLT